MADLRCNYLGISLKSPIIAASSGFTDSVNKIEQIARHGAGAVVLKSIFEEEILLEADKTYREEAEKTGREEFLDYLDHRIRHENISKYLNLIRETKAKIDIPVIASINCKSSHEWMSFAKEIEKAGADALELNIFVLPSSLENSSEQNEKIYFEIAAAVTKMIKIPVVLKISFYFSNLGQFIQKISNSGIKGLVLFNRFYSPDFNVDTLEVTPSHVLSYPGEISMPLRWISMMSGKVGCNLSASTGVADGKSIIKLILAGADTVQVASVLYRHGISYLDILHHELNEWMDQHGFESIEDFKGKLSQAKHNDPDVFERVQFMKYFSDKETLV
jgi:dihydroorotate dehydrogenase (fumarate)